MLTNQTKLLTVYTTSTRWTAYAQGNRVFYLPPSDAILQVERFEAAGWQIVWGNDTCDLISNPPYLNPAEGFAGDSIGNYLSRATKTVGISIPINGLEEVDIWHDPIHPALPWRKVATTTARKAAFNLAFNPHRLAFPPGFNPNQPWLPEPQTAQTVEKKIPEPDEELEEEISLTISDLGIRVDFEDGVYRVWRKNHWVGLVFRLSFAPEETWKAEIRFQESKQYGTKEEAIQAIVDVYVTAEAWQLLRTRVLNFTLIEPSRMICQTAEGKGYPIALDGNKCSCPGHQVNGWCDHCDELQRRLTVGSDLCPTLSPHLKTVWDMYFLAGDQEMFLQGTSDDLNAECPDSRWDELLEFAEYLDVKITYSTGETYWLDFFDGQLEFYSTFEGAWARLESAYRLAA